MCAAILESILLQNSEYFLAASLRMSGALFVGRDISAFL